MGRARNEPEDQPVVAVEAEAEAAAEPAAEEPAEQPEVRAEPAAEAEPASEPTAEPGPDAETPVEETPAAEAVPAVAEKPKRKPAASRAKAEKKPVEKKPAAKKPAARKPRAAAKKAGERKPIVRLPKPERGRGRQKERRGVVVSDAMDKTIVVRIDMSRPHPVYKKVVRRSQKFHAHDAANQARTGDLVRIVETRPLSKTKSWRLAEILEAAK